MSANCTLHHLHTEAAALHQLAQADEQVHTMRAQAEARGYMQAHDDMGAMVHAALDEVRDNIAIASRAAFLRGWREGLAYGAFAGLFFGSALAGLLLGALKG